MVLVVDCDLKNINIRVFGRKRGEKLSTSFSMGIDESLASADFLRRRIISMAGREAIEAFSFRIVFSGDLLGIVEQVDGDFLKRFEKLTGFFPFYVPLMSEILKRFREAFDSVPVIAFSETSFFSGLPDERKYYALPFEYYRETGIRKWGFHGISHASNSKAVDSGKKVISIVMDRQTTVCGLSGRKPLTISLGYTPLEGIMSSKGCGDIDPGIVFYLMNVHGFSVHRIDEILKSESGFLGVTGCNMDIPELLKLRGRKVSVDLAFGIYLSQVLKHAGEAVAALGGLDAIVFAGPGTVGAEPLVWDIARSFSFLGAHAKDLPWERNEGFSVLSTEESDISIMINNMDVARIIYDGTVEFLGVAG